MRAVSVVVKKTKFVCENELKSIGSENVNRKSIDLSATLTVLLVARVT